jgi:two-component system phosphate regulon sensor histidine kinase PhoR
MMGDRIHLTNLIINLIDNAIKYNLNTPRVVINTVNDDHSLLIRVQDNGIGISKSNAKKIFDKFFRVHTGNVHDFKGFGLGLNYVKATTEMHNGTVSVDSEPGKGSTFTIKLPVS